MRTIFPIFALTLFTLAISVPAWAVSVDGAWIHSTVHGTGPKTIVFVHGWTCDETSWDEQVPVFERNYRVITVDLPGHGKSGLPTTGSLTMELFAKAIEAVRLDAKAGKIVLVGHSMGTPVILQYAHMYPAKVAGLVVVDGNLRQAVGTTVPNLDRFRGPEGLKARETAIRGMFGPSATPEIQDHVLKMMLAAPEETAIQALASMYIAPNWTQAKMTVPALGIYADRSGADDPAYFKQIFPHGSRSQIAGTGHFVMLEKPEEFNKLLADFLPKAQF